MKSMRFVLITCATTMLIVLAAAWSQEPAVPPAAKQACESSAACCDACEAAAARSTNKELKSTQSLVDLTDIAVLRDKFNADQGHPRMIALLSPTCPGCIKSAELFRTEILEKYKDADLKAYVVWLPMLPADARERWDPAIIHDKRATHFWNQQRSIGTWFAEKVQTCEPLGPVAWDVVYLFDATAKWDEIGRASCRERV